MPEVIRTNLICGRNIDNYKQLTKVPIIGKPKYCDNFKTVESDNVTSFIPFFPKTFHLGHYK